MREPVAEGFYPSDPEELRKQVQEFLDDAKVKNLNPKGLVVPHAGFPFSGDIAAYAYKTIVDEDFDKIILLGPNHYGKGAKIAISDQDWKTPLGVVPVDEDAAREISENCEGRIDNNAHRREHSLEVQIPFLQVTQKDFEIVPVSIKHDLVNPSSMEDLGEAVEKVSGENTLVIASSDLVHFGPNYRYMPVEEDRVDFVKEKDRDFIDSVVQFDPEGTIEKGEETTVCGYGGIAALIHALNEKCERNTILKHGTSYEKTQDENNIVGYASIAFF